MKIKSLGLICALGGIFVGRVLGAEPGSIVVDGSKPGAKLGPLFYGLMTEEINHAYDGGLYAELIQNRIFQDGDKPVNWDVVQSGSGVGSIAIDEQEPVNTTALTRSLRLDISAVGDGERVGVCNSGYWGIPVWPNTKYHASFYARASEGFTGPLSVDVESNDGKTTFAIASVQAVDSKWKKYELDLTTGDVPKSTGNRFVISGASKGSVWLSLVSLFPPTYHDRPNGNRIDLMQKMADLHPAFLRFPGGNYLEGNTIPTRFEWKKTIGPLEDRPGHMGCWSYRSSDGLGLQEFLNWCEDLKMQPLLAVYAGYSLHGDYVKPGPDLEPFVQEALEEIEYCIGDASTTWGKKRADSGHPAPYDIHYIEIGNEDWFDKSGSYDGRFAQLFDAIKAKYPKLLCIATAPVKMRRPDLYDDHDYPHSQQMLAMTERYDKPDPNRPKVFFGEWATEEGQPTPNMRGALADAAWLTGLQRDADTVLLNCYAPLLVNVSNRKAWQWPTNLIGYDAASSFGSPSYYAQSMFSRNWGDTVLSTTVEQQKLDLPTPPPSTGGIGLGTWHTTAEFKDVKVTDGDKTLYQSDFAGGLKGWKPESGKWDTTTGSLMQTDPDAETHMTVGEHDWRDYTLSLKARKVDGREGFLILFHATDAENYYWVNIGGWRNGRTAIQQMIGGQPMVQISNNSRFKVENNKWYDIRLELKGNDIKCFIDDKLIVSATEGGVIPKQTLFAGVTRVDATGEVILKVVNVIPQPQTVQIDLQNLPALSHEGSLETLRGDPGVQNTVAEPTKIAPVSEKIEEAGNKFTHEFPGNSVSVIRLKPAGP